MAESTLGVVPKPIYERPILRLRYFHLIPMAYHLAIDFGLSTPLHP